MPLKIIYILQDNKSFTKFCAFEDRVFGCREIYGCHIACPLWRARAVEQLCNEKGMTIGEAHKASLRLILTDRERVASLIASMTAKPTIDLKELLDVLKGHSI
jgi:hypothetical protein